MNPYNQTHTQAPKPFYPADDGEKAAKSGTQKAAIIITINQGQ